MSSADPIWQTLKSFAAARFEQFGATSFADLHAKNPIFFEMPDAQIDFLLRKIDHVWRWLDSCVSGRDTVLRDETLAYFVANMQDYIHRRNQFIVLDAHDTDDLAALYALFLADFRGALQRARQREDLRRRLSRALAVHRDDLEHFVNRLGATNGSAALVHSEPAASAYSPELQLHLFGVEPDDLRGPVLDLGCGARGQLVAYLRAHGVPAVGIDRGVPEYAYVVQGDWLALDLEPGRWGTVISHMAFSTFFLHHHLRPGGQAERYARRYMAILRALAPGGAFMYTPGLPFIEALLSLDAYRVERRPIPALAHHPAQIALREQVGMDVCYACCVMRL